MSFKQLGTERHKHIKRWYWVASKASQLFETWYSSEWFHPNWRDWNTVIHFSVYWTVMIRGIIIYRWIQSLTRLGSETREFPVIIDGDRLEKEKQSW